MFPGPRVSRPSAWPVRYLSASSTYRRSAQRFDSVQISSKSPTDLSPAGRPLPSCGDGNAFEQQWGSGKFPLLYQAADAALSQSAWWMKRSEHSFKLRPVSAKVLRPTRSLSISHIILLALACSGQSFIAHKSSCQPASVSIFRFSS